MLYILSIQYKYWKYMLHFIHNILELMYDTTFCKENIKLIQETKSLLERKLCVIEEKKYS